MEKKIIFLGTSSVYPTKERNHPSVYLQFRDEKMLFDCGEGTQRQLAIAGIPSTRITRIFLTHWHGDHALGIAGILQSMSMSQRQRELYIYGPKGTKNKIDELRRIFHFEEQFEVHVEEVDSGIILDTKFYRIEALKVKHRIPCLAYSFIEKDRRKINLEYVSKFGLKQHKILGKLQRGETIVWKGHEITPEKGTIVVKGKKITYVTDTSYFKGLEKFAKDSDVLICEATFASDLEEKATGYTHMTAKDAATLALNSNSKLLIITHFSHRYKTPSKLLKEAKTVFKNVKAAKDFMELVLD